jgi:hypothetical protein
VYRPQVLTLKDKSKVLFSQITDFRHVRVGLET